MFSNGNVSPLPFFSSFLSVEDSHALSPYIKKEKIRYPEEKGKKRRAPSSQARTLNHISGA
jgi:hypothetical protein